MKLRALNVDLEVRECSILRRLPLEDNDRIVGILEIFNDKAFSPGLSNGLSNNSFNFD